MRLHLIFALAMSILLLAWVPQPVFSQETVAPVEIEDPSPNDLRELMRLLADQRVQNWLSESVEAGEIEATEAKGAPFRDRLVVGLNKVRTRMSALGEAWVLLPETPKMLIDRWQEEMTLHRKVRSLTFLVIFLFVGAGLEWLYRQYTSIPLLRLAMLPHVTPGKRALAALTRAAIIAVGLLLFSFGSVGAFLAFEWPPLIETVVLNFLAVIIALRVVRALTMFILAPNVPALRLVPLSNQKAKYLHLMIAQAVGVVFFAMALSDVFARLTMGQDGSISPAALSVSVAAAAIACVVLLFVVFRSFRLWRRSKGTGLQGRRMNWQLYINVLIVITFCLWLIGTGPLMESVLLIGILFPMLNLLRSWVDFFFDQASEAQLLEITKKAAKDAEHRAQELLENAAEDTVEVAQNSVVVSELNLGAEAVEETEIKEDEALILPDSYGTLRLISQRIIRFVVVFLAVILLVNIWGTSIIALSESASIAGQVLSVLIDAIFVILVADLIWAWAKTSIDKRLAAYEPPEDGQAPGPEARMATLLPLLRVTLMVALLIMVVFSILSSLGVNIGPLIAGAGVLGIAIGFGAQSLVRDVVSGVFFLIDDAFRIGEYIEIGELRGTVESISIRSLRVRHHRGAIHTIPFGELKSLTNHSRDWVIMKLEFRVPFDTDLQLVKKLVKKVGAELQANEFYGTSILSTLKSQGVRRMEEFNMVVGVKFMTKPGEQWLVRRDAYQKVRDAFDANGIRMAERNVVVEIQGGEELSDAEKQGVAGAAQSAAEGPKLPPGPVPDEP
ncbi:MAG: mechanosensitive ion channel family protein [Rhodobacteraceae bacterium]|nr:mechanosensitive ion channel family protein [Paracoccaceae bacterium]